MVERAESVGETKSEGYNPRYSKIDYPLGDVQDRDKGYEPKDRAKEEALDDLLNRHREEEGERPVIIQERCDYDPSAKSKSRSEPVLEWVFI